ncbi:MFS transporter [Rhodococcoides corynebacterioides]|uniref:MFS transporter n=1 Tax=Rhodococcoides corynebacterioides TaxID=53972 RepID=A0ABS7P6X0_9NOCA|nr:MFS transporter [Rhodococcus corynebacterioides]MBY6367389.1 MFS transporter [Rhodococcus corynebacterioides]MBY6407649.1 MFS transporter [Rhodococcus corynebacterioides]
MSASRSVAPTSYPVTSRAFGLAIIALSGMQLMAVLDGTVVNLALAPLQAELNLSDAGRNWVVSSYVLAFGGLMLLGGRMGDSFGRKRMFLTGVALFTVASAVCGLAQNEAMLVGARIVQGAGAAVASPTAFALVATTFAPGPVRNQAIAIYAAMTGVGSFSGLIIGGALTEVSWRWIFLINVPIGVAILALGARSLVETAAERTALDVPGAILATLGSTGVVFGIVEGPERGWTDTITVASIVIGLALLAAFLMVERRAANPLLPFDLFRDRDRVATFAAIFFSGGALFAMTVIVAVFVQDVLDYSPLRAGISFIPFGGGMALAAVVSSWLAPRLAPRWIVFTGAVLTVGYLTFASRIDVGASYWSDLFLPIGGIGFGVGLAVIALPLCAIAQVRAENIGPLTAISLVAQNLGGPLGLAVVSAMAAAKTLSLGGVTGSAVSMTEDQVRILGEGYTFGLLGCAGLAAVAAVSALFIRYSADDVASAKAAQEAARG